MNDKVLQNVAETDTETDTVHHTTSQDFGLLETLN